MYQSSGDWSEERQRNNSILVMKYVDNIRNQLVPKKFLPIGIFDSSSTNGNVLAVI